MTRYRNKAYLDEINDVDTDDEHVLQEQEELVVKNAEEDSWKKRYGDLRRKAQQDTANLENRMKSLENQLNEATQAQIKLPKTEAEVKRWVETYPDVADILKTLIHIETKDKQTEIINTRQEIDDLKHERAKEAAFSELLKIHPDFNEINADPEFHEWVSKQHKNIADSLYVNDLDYEWAADSIEKYKLQTAAKAKAAPAPRSDSRREAATAVRTPRAQEPINPNSGEWTESRVEALSRRDYERYEDEIDAAIRSGKFVYDLSAGAR